MITAVIIVYQIWKYCRLMNIIKKHSSSFESPVIGLVKNELGVSKKIAVVKSGLVSVPMTAGLVNAAIILPQDDKLASYEQEYIIRHEMVHIRNKDAWLKLLGLLVIAVHWYNPFSYLLFYSLSQVNEIYSDRIATLHYTKKQRYEYCSLMIGFSTLDKGRSHKALSRFPGDAQSRIKERIDSVMKESKNHYMVSGLTGALCLILGVSLTFLYQGPVHIQASYYDEGFEDGGTIFILNDTVEEDILEYDNYFIDGDSNTVRLYENESRDPCNKHKYVSGTRKRHLKAGTECKILYYSALRCPVCGHYETDEIYKEESFIKCPHSLAGRGED